MAKKLKKFKVEFTRVETMLVKVEVNDDSSAEVMAQMAAEAKVKGRQDDAGEREASLWQRSISMVWEETN